jgi:hypothetical protein
MKSLPKKVTILFVLVTIASGIIIYSCKKTSSGSGSSNQANLQVRLADSPFPDVSAVWIDVTDIQINYGDSGWTSLSGAHPGEYNLMDLTNGKDTLLADALVPAGKISQIRLILGDSNFIVTKSGEQIDLKIPSGQESGLKVQLDQTVSGGVLYRLVLDFDAGRSIVKAGNSGMYILKPVIRALSFKPSGGNIQGVVQPDSVRTTIFAIMGTDTITSTFSDTTNGNYYFNDVPAGAYSLSFVPADTTFMPAQQNVTVTLGQTTIADTVVLQH